MSQSQYKTHGASRSESKMTCGGDVMIESLQDARATNKNGEEGQLEPSEGSIERDEIVLSGQNLQ